MVWEDLERETRGGAGGGGGGHEPCQRSLVLKTYLIANYGYQFPCILHINQEASKSLDGEIMWSNSQVCHPKKDIEPLGTDR